MTCKTKRAPRRCAPVPSPAVRGMAPLPFGGHSTRLRHLDRPITHAQQRCVGRQARGEGAAEDGVARAAWNARRSTTRPGVRAARRAAMGRGAAMGRHRLCAALTKLPPTALSPHRLGVLMRAPSSEQGGGELERLGSELVLKVLMMLPLVDVARARVV